MERKVIPASGAAIFMAAPMSSSKPARQEYLWATPSLRVMTMKFGEAAIRSHGNSMVTIQAAMTLGSLSMR